MKPGLPIGARHQETLRVDESLQAKVPIGFGGQRIHPLLGTAPLIEALEWVSRQLILPYLEPDEEGVGAALEFRHLTPVPLGETIRLLSEVVEISNHRVKTRIQAFQQNKLVADGMFSQAIVQKDRLYPPLSIEQATIDLHNPDHNYRFSLELQQWESTLTCTPYDEWLICTVRLQSPIGTQIAQGPILLRIEVESVIQALLGMLTQETSLPFESDFLESALKLTLHKKNDGAIVMGVALQPSDARNDNIQLSGVSNESDIYPISFPVDPNCILPWCDAVKTRLLSLQEQL